MDVSEPEERAVRDYVNSQSPPEDRAELVQKVGSQRILGRVHNLYDVRCVDTRWWVITEPTNLYLQSDFPEVEQALIFHLGLAVYLANRDRTTIDDEHEEQISASWRRYRQAVDTMDAAAEAEDFQSVGIKCRDALIALVRTHMNDDWVGELADVPKAADVKGWGNIFAERLTEGRLRSYTRALVDKTWDLTVWLQHHSNATPTDADMVLDATAHLLSVMGRAIHRHEAGPSPRCPRCESYRLREDVETTATPAPGLLLSTVCESCGWRSGRAFEAFGERVSPEQIRVYLDAPATGPSDRPHRADRDDTAHEAPETRAGPSQLGS